MNDNAKSRSGKSFASKLFRLGAKLAVFALLLQVVVPTALGLISSQADAAGVGLTSSPSFCAYPGAKVAIDPAGNQKNAPEIPEDNMVLCVFCFVCQTGTADSNTITTALEWTKDLKENTKAASWYFVTLPQSKFASFRHASRAPPSFI